MPTAMTDVISERRTWGPGMKTPAERQALWRIRETLGLIKAYTWAPPGFVEYLIDLGAITPTESADPDALGNAILTWAIEQAEEVRGHKFV